MDSYQTELYINGTWHSGKQSFAVFNPYDQTQLAKVADAQKEDALTAIDAAHQSFHHWSQSPPLTRSNHLKRWSQLIQNHADELAHLLSKEQGKILNEARQEIQNCASIIEWAAQEAMRIYGTTLPPEEPDRRNFIIKQAIGPVAAITPWNFPAAAVAIKCASALAAGCTVVLKPSEKTPLIALKLAELASRAEFPAGVLNVIPCQDPNPIGTILCQDHRIRLITFTGSTAVGKHIASLAGAHMKPVAMELGGNAPFIVHEDADIELAVNHALGARLYNAGQICVGANRFYIHQRCYETFNSLLCKELQDFNPGNAFDSQAKLGPLIDSDAVESIDRLCQNACSKGAKLLWEGKRQTNHPLLYPPRILIDVNETMEISQKEIFGPVFCIFPFASKAEGLQRANQSPSGLAAYVFSQNHRTLWEFSEQLDFAMIGANTANIFSTKLPFGGIKESGLGREGGIHSLDDFLVSKNVSLGVQS